MQEEKNRQEAGMHLQQPEKYSSQKQKRHLGTHTQTALCVYIHTTNTMSKHNEFKLLASADQHFKSQIVRDCMRPILSEIISVTVRDQRKSQQRSYLLL